MNFRVICKLRKLIARSMRTRGMVLLMTLLLLGLVRQQETDESSRRYYKRKHILAMFLLSIGFALILSLAPWMIRSAYATPVAQVNAICGGTVFRDDNGNGVYDAVTDQLVAGVVMEIFDSSGTSLGAAFTDSSGVWTIDNLPENTAIRVQVMSKPGALNDGPLGTDHQGLVLFTDTTACTELTTGLLLASACSDLPLEIGNRIWFDENANGIQDVGEAGIGSVTVNLYIQGGSVPVDTQMTDPDGIYIFKNLDANTAYEIRLDNAPDFADGGPLFDTSLTNAGQGADPELDSDANLNGNNQPQIDAMSGPQGSSIHRYDIGFVPPATIGDLVWIDYNANGVQDIYTPTYSTAFENFHGIDFTGLLPAAQPLVESGIPSVTLSLFSPGPNNILGDGDDLLEGTQVTDETGRYLFRGLDPGSYRVAVDETTTPTGYSQASDPDITQDSVTDVVGLVAGQQHLTADFGYAGNVDLEIVKAADLDYFDQRDTITWSVAVTNHGTISAPQVVVADVMGEDDMIDVILGRIFELYWSAVEPGGYFNDTADVNSQSAVEDLIRAWIADNVSVTGTGWRCAVDAAIAFPEGWPLPDELQESYENDAMPQDVKLYWLCELTSGALAAGASAPAITFSINNEFNYLTHLSDYPDRNSPDWDTILLQGYGHAPHEEINYARTESAYGAEPLDTYPNEDDAIIQFIGDLQWEKALVSTGPFDVGDEMTFVITVTNSSTVPWFSEIHFWDRFENSFNIEYQEIPSTPWDCMLFTFSTPTVQCRHDAIPGGLQPGDSITATVSATFDAGYGACSACFVTNPRNTVRMLRESVFDNNPGNNFAEVPYTMTSSAWNTAKGAGQLTANGTLSWTITMPGVIQGDIPAGQVFVVHEILNVAMPFIGVISPDWQCEPHPVAVANGGSFQNWQRCWFAPVNLTEPVPPLTIETQFVNGITNMACPARGIRNGYLDWDFGLHDNGGGTCPTSPAFNGVPTVPTDLAITKTHNPASEPWVRGTNQVFTLTISELGVGPDRLIVWDQPNLGLELNDIRNINGDSLIDGSGDPIVSTTDGWACAANFADDPNTTADESQYFQCVRDYPLDGTVPDTGANQLITRTSDILTVEVQVTATAGDIVGNDSAIEGLTRAEPDKANGDSGYVDNAASDSATVPTPDLKIEKTHVANPVLAGIPFTFTVQVSNNDDFSAIPAGAPVPVSGPLPLPLVVTDTFANGMNYLGFSGTDWNCTSDGLTPPTVVCTFDDADNTLLPGESATPLIIDAVVPSASLVHTNNAVAVATFLSPIVFYSATPDSDTDFVNIVAPFVEVQKSASQAQTIVGDPATGSFQFTLSVDNTTGTSVAPAPLVVTDTVPVEFTVTNVDGGADWDCSATVGQDISCTYVGGGATPINFPQTTSSITVDATTAADAAAGTLINTMSASHGGVQSIDSVRQSSTSIGVLRYADLAVGKVRDITAPLPGETIAYSIIVTNTGPSPAENVQVVDTLPYGAALVDTSGTDLVWTCASNNGTPETVTCDLSGVLTGNGTTTPPLVLNVLIGAESYPGISNFVTVSTTTEIVPGSTTQRYTINEYVAITGCIGDYVWLDTGSDGVEESTTAGTDGIFDTLDDIFGTAGPGPDELLGTADDCVHAFQSVNMSLDWAGPDEAFGTADDVTSFITTTTDIDGFYNFEFLPPGEYRVNVNKDSGTLVCDASALATYEPTFDLDSGTTSPDDVSLVIVGGASPLVRNDVDFGYGVQASQLALEKTLVSPANGVVMVGDPVIFSLTISNLGQVAVAELNLDDTFDVRYLSFDNASITPDSSGAGTLSWVGTNDGVNPGTGSLQGELPLGPGKQFVITVAFTATNPTK